VALGADEVNFHDPSLRHTRSMTSMLLNTFDAEFVVGGYASHHIPWEIGAQMYGGGKTSRTGMLLESEKDQRRRDQKKLDERREALGVKKKRKTKQKMDKIR
jgi:hypothetical protein